MSKYASKDLMEVFDKVIGLNLYEVPTNELLNTFKAFLASDKTRDKIIFALLKRIKTHMNEFSLSNVCDLAYTFSNVNADLEGIYDLMEPYILNKMHSLTEDNLIAALIGYNNPKINKNYHVKDVLETTLINQADRMSIGKVAQALYFYAKNRIGQRLLIETLIDRLHRESDNTDIDAPTLVTILVGLNLSGAD
jgi:hypothetical protein